MTTPRDWATDFDHTDPVWRDDPFPIWADLRARCPIAHSDRFEGGAFLPTRMEDVRAIAYDTDHFSSRRVIVRERKIEPPTPSPPITADPPHHRATRMPLLAALHPREVERLREGTRATCHSLIDTFAGARSVDAATDYAQHVPVRVIARLLGVDEGDGDLFRRWIHEILVEGIRDPVSAHRGTKALSAYLRAAVAARAGAKGDDLICRLRDSEVDGAPMSDAQLVGTLRLVLVAGIDTTWSAIGASLWHLARSPADAERLRAEPELLPVAVEELLRAYAPVTMAREVVGQVTVAGCPMAPGAMVLLSFPAANRDPAAFPDPDRVILHRQDNRHAAFGLGIHRCAGSHLARMELTEALRAWIERIPAFTLRPGAPVVWSEGTVRGPRSLPLLLGPHDATER